MLPTTRWMKQRPKAALIFEAVGMPGLHRGPGAIGMQGLTKAGSALRIKLSFPWCFHVVLSQVTTVSTSEPSKLLCILNAVV